MMAQHLCRPAHILHHPHPHHAAVRIQVHQAAMMKEGHSIRGI